MIVVLDTNILLREADAADSRHTLVCDKRRELLQAGHDLVTAPQCLYEFWTVATRPTVQNGLGLTPGEAFTRIEEIRAAYPILADPHNLVDRWLQLCLKHSTSGRPSHDARVVAWMDAYRITHLMTLNPADFRRYDHLLLIVPGEAT
jgi:predicted nucleic acid-binding protein